MGSIGSPLGDKLSVIFVEIDVDHLPIRLVVIDAVKAGAPTVETEKEPVLQNGPAIGVSHPPIISVTRVVFQDGVVIQLGCGGTGSWLAQDIVRTVQSLNNP